MRGDCFKERPGFFWVSRRGKSQKFREARMSVDPLGKLMQLSTAFHWEEGNGEGQG